MAITRSTAAERTKVAGRQGVHGATAGRGPETFLLLLAFPVIVAGVLLVYQALSERGAHPAPLNLNAIRSANELLPLLGFLETPADREFAARRLVLFLRDHSIESIRELSQARVAREDVRRARGLRHYAAAAAEAGQQVGPRRQSVPLLTSAQIQQIRPWIAVRSWSRFRNSAAICLILLLTSFSLVHLVWRRLSFSGDCMLLPLVCLLSGIGFLFMIRLRDPLRESLLFPDFTMGVVAGCLLLLFCSLPDYESTGLHRLAYVPLLASFAASLALLIFGSGPGASDAKVNLALGPVTVQPVELIKVLLVLFLAGYFAERWEFLRALKEPAGRLPKFLRAFNLPRIQYALPVLAGVALATAFFFLQRDLGPALVFTGVFLSLYAVARARAGGLILGCVLLIFAFICGYYLGTPQTVAARVSMWLAPWNNFLRSGGDHLAQSLWGFASGASFGTGLGLGEPQLTPAVHSDLILAAIGEELGFVGILAVYTAYGLLVARALRITQHASGHYSFFLGLGFTLLLAMQVALISGGVLGLTPLSGVVTPFLNYGRSSALANFAILGVLASLSARPGPPRQNEEFRQPLRWVGRILGIAGALILIQAFRVQVLQADEVLVRSALVRQADGRRRHSYNPRILEASRLIPRGSILDRNGIPLAASAPEALEQRRRDYERIGVDIDGVLRRGSRRMYPFGALTFHLLGDVRSRTNWGAPNTSFVERDSNAQLQGFDDYAIVDRVENTPGGERHSVLKRDYSELVPLVRYRWRPEHRDVQSILNRERNLRLAIDVRLQKRAAELLEKHVRLAGRQKGAAIVLDAATGDILASVTYPFAGAEQAMNSVPPPEEVLVPRPSESLLDRPRYGLYPPGSSFKLVTASAALLKEQDAASRTYDCRRLPGGRVGNYVRGWGQPVRDDILDKTPHGAVHMSTGLAVSCNAYFGQLGTYLVGADALLSAAQQFGIRVAVPNTAAQLKDALPQASYGQGQVVASPLQMARVAAVIAADGRLPQARIVLDDKPAPPEAALPAGNARLIAEYMRRVVTEGTGRVLQSWSIPIAGKTGTAELRNQPSHAWFVGFAPYGNSNRKIAFAVIIENGRYGAQVAAPLAGDLVVSAASLGLIDRE